MAYDFEESIDRLVENNITANDPFNPYTGVSALFNGDLHTTDPAYAPREHWDVISPYVIKHKPIDSIERD